MASQSAAAATPPWSDLLPELLGRIASRCLYPADRARFRSVCRSWHSAIRHHCPRILFPPPQPCIVLPYGSVIKLSDDDRHLPSAILPSGFYSKPCNGGPHRIPLPEGTTCVGSTGSWLALCRDRDDDQSQTMFQLHYPFSNTTVPLPDVDAIGAKTPQAECFRVRKVLMRSGADDVIAVKTESRRYPFVLSLPGSGKRAWTPDPDAPPFIHVVDLAFLGDKLYGITKAGDLFSFHVSSMHDDQHPSITHIERVIRHPPVLDLQTYARYFSIPLAWSEDEDDDDDGDELLPLSGEDEDNSDDCFEGDEDCFEDEEDSSEEDEDCFEDEEDSSEEDESSREEDCFEEDDAFNHLVPSSVDWRVDEANNDCMIVTFWYLVAVESCGKLIMVRRELQWPDARPRYTRTVEVFEADIEAGVWVPLSGELGLGNGGQALFLSNRFSKCVSTSEYGKEAELDDDSIYFMDTGDVFHMRSATISPARWGLNYWGPTWLFTPAFII